MSLDRSHSRKGMQLAGRIALVTGGTAAHPLAVSLAARGATVVVTMGDARAAAALARRIITQTGNPRVHGLVVDLTCLGSVRVAAAEFIVRYRKLHLLVNTPGERLGPLLLANLLLDTMKQSGAGKVVRVMSRGDRAQIWAAH